MRERASGVLLLKNLLFTLIMPGTVAVYVPLLIVRGRVPGTGMWRLASVIVLLAGASIYGWCVWDFAVFGRGTPAPIDAPKRLVVRGLYRFTRNPMYVGVLTTILGWAALYEAPGLVMYALCVWLGFQCFVVFYEEPHLRKVFGRSYEEYCARVRRWVPRLSRAA